VEHTGEHRHTMLSEDIWEILAVLAQATRV
jgi:hypothetical protein